MRVLGEGIEGWGFREGGSPDAAEIEVRSRASALTPERLLAHVEVPRGVSAREMEHRIQEKLDRDEHPDGE